MVTPPINTQASSLQLYAFILRLRPLQYGTLMPFSGELVHGAFLHWLRDAAPDIADWLHEGQKRRLFTCSSLHFSPSMQPHLKAERQNIHLPLDPQKTYTVRFTLLAGAFETTGKRPSCMVPGMGRRPALKLVYPRSRSA